MAKDGRLTAFNSNLSPPALNCQKTSRLSPSQCWKLAASGWRQWWDLGNNCYSRLRMEMRMTVDWQSTLLGGLSSLSGIKVKPWQRDDSVWRAYGVSTCWGRTDLSVISRNTDGSAFATGDQIMSSVWFINDVFKKQEIPKNNHFFLFYLIFSNKLNIAQKMQIYDTSGNDFHARHSTCLELTQTRTLCRRMPTVSL